MISFLLYINYLPGIYYYPFVFPITYGISIHIIAPGLGMNPPRRSFYVSLSACRACRACSAPQKKISNLNPLTYDSR